MKQNYEVAEMEVIAFEAEDVIATSRGMTILPEGDNENIVPWPFG